MTAPNPAHSLGTIQRDIAARLSAYYPTSTRQAAQWIIGKDHGYAAMALVRLAERGVAQETVEGSFLYLRGPLWQTAAEHYNWVDVDAPQERTD